MRCHYEVLEVDRNADEDTIKKAYRKLALKWHPDKNPENLEECTKYFAVIQQAYDVLSDPHERAWYDRHREEMLMGGLEEKYRDNTLDLSQYMTSDCYKGFGDDEKGFYAVYRQVFDILANEDYEFSDDSELKYPMFGNSESDYDTVVGPFYGFWQSFSTIRPYYWINKHNIRDAVNSRHLRAMKKENNKVREMARKERNEQIRELVGFIRKRDKRVRAHRKLLDERRLEQEKKTELNRLERIKQNLLQAGEHKESEESKLGHLEDLREIEEALEAEFGTEEIEDNSENSEDLSSLYCIACKKAFKSQKALANHERTKKHIDLVAELKKHMQEEDALLLEEHVESRENGLDASTKNGSSSKRSKKQKKKQRKNFELDALSNSDDEKSEKEEASNSIPAACSNQDDNAFSKDEPLEEINIFLKAAKEAKQNEQRGDKSKNKQKEVVGDRMAHELGPKVGICDRCGEAFESRSKLFGHLKESGHATIKSLPNAAVLPKPKGGKKGKKK